MRTSGKLCRSLSNMSHAAREDHARWITATPTSAMCTRHPLTSDHSSILLLPTYRQKLKQALPIIREVHRWTDQKCIEDVVPTKPVRVYPNQKPWLNCEVLSTLGRTAFKSGHTEEYKKASYTLWKTIRAAKHQLNTFSQNHTVLPKNYRRLSPPLCLRGDVCKAFKCVNIRKAPGPDGIPGRILKVCAHELAGVFTDISNLSLSLSVVPACFKLATIVPVPKTARITTLNDWRPVALTSIISKCFEKLVRDCSLLPATLDPMQFAYRQNRSTDDAIALTLHTALSHLDKQNMYTAHCPLPPGQTEHVCENADYSSASNTIVLSRLDIKLRDLGSGILNFLTDQRQVVKLAGITSSSPTLSTGAPQCCVLSPLLYSLYTHDCTARHSSNVIIKFADDTTTVGLISNNNEEAYREEVSFLTHWCRENNQGADSGLQEAGESAHPHHHQWGRCREGQQL
ncbi:hypothetical protein NFI96_008531 [Prochilodus magdalenae]|nr:hypothetical protein NFI96_008531 [Prochilodus magdalenae]